MERVDQGADTDDRRLDLELNSDATGVRRGVRGRDDAGRPRRRHITY